MGLPCLYYICISNIYIYWIERESVPFSSRIFQSEGCELSWASPLLPFSFTSSSILNNFGLSTSRGCWGQYPISKCERDVRYPNWLIGKEANPSQSHIHRDRREVRCWIFSGNEFSSGHSLRCKLILKCRQMPQSLW
jgi:hypothetical protein